MPKPSKSKPAKSRRALKLFIGGNGSVTVVTRITKGYTCGTLTVEKMTLNFSNGEFQSAFGAGTVSIDILR